MKMKKKKEKEKEKEKEKKKKKKKKKKKRKNQLVKELQSFELKKQSVKEFSFRIFQKEKEGENANDVMIAIIHLVVIH